MSAAEPAPAELSRRRVLLAAAARVVVWFLLLGLVWFLIRLLHSIDWSAVVDALAQISAWEGLALLALIALRQMFSAAPLALFTKGLGVGRAVASELVGVLIATVTPPPADLVARAALLRAWGVDVARGLAGLGLTTVLFYAVRLAVPVVGAVLMWWTVGESAMLGWVAAISGLAAGVMILLLGLLFRGSGSAERLGRRIGAVAQRIRSSLPGPEAVAARLVEFHGHVADRWHRFWGWSTGSLSAMVAVEALTLVVVLRFLGVSASEAPLLVIVASFLSAYLLIATPFLGLGVLDAAVVALIADRSDADPALLVAGMVVWRVCVQLVPLVAGLVPLVELRRLRRRPDAPATPPDV